MLTSFEQLNLIPELKSAVESMGYVTPTPVQAEAIPYILDGRDMLGEAPTGTGKTAAFGLPMLNKINPMSSDVQAMIICPTRELAMQIERELRKFAVNMPHIKMMTVCGGQNYNRQLASIRKKPSIIVGTPGRLIDHLEKNHLKIKGLKMLVLDEADEMLNMGFREDIDSILTCVESHHQTLLFSATMTKEIQSISANYQKNPVHIKTKHNDNVIPQIDQQYIRVKEGKKLDAFVKIWQDNDYRLAIMFCNTKRRVDELCKQLEERQFLVSALHGDMRQRERDSVMRSFRNGDINVLIATDVAARGIDVNNIEAVFNYDIPIDNEYYIHRIGRTARAGKKGIAYAFVTDKDFHKLAIYEKITKMAMTEIAVPGLSNDKPVKLNGTKAEKTTVRLFINFGIRDKFDENGLKSALLSKAELPANAIDELKLLETYSFLEVEKEYVEKFLDVNGLSLGQRKIAVEIAGNKSSGGGERRSSGNGDRNSSYGGERKSFGGDRSSSYGDRPKRNYGDSERTSSDGESRSFGGERKSYGGERNSSYGGERKSYGGDRSSSYGDRPKRNYGDSERTSSGSSDGKSYGSERNSSYGGEGKSYGGERKSYGGSSSSYSDRPKRNYGDSEHTSSGSSDGKSYGGERKSYGSERNSSYGGERKSYGGSSSSYGDRPKRNYGDSEHTSSGSSEGKSFGGERKSYGSERNSSYGGERKSYGGSSSSYSDRPKRTYGDSDKPKVFGDKPKRTGEVNKFFGEKPKSFSEGSKPYGDKPKSYGDNTPKRSSSKPSAPRGYKKFSK